MTPTSQASSQDEPSPDSPAWNIKEEIMAQMAGIADWGGQFVVPLPEVAVLPVPQTAHLV